MTDRRPRLWVIPTRNRHDQVGGAVESVSVRPSPAWRRSWWSSASAPHLELPRNPRLRGAPGFADVRGAQRGACTAGRWITFLDERPRPRPARRRVAAIAPATSSK